MSLGPMTSLMKLTLPSENMNFKMETDSIIFVFSRRCLHAVSSIDGDVLWKRELTTESLEIQRIFQPVDSDIIYAVGFVGSSQFHAYQINAKTGALLEHISADFLGGFSGEISFVSNDILVTLDATGSNVVVISYRDGEISFHQTHIPDLVAGSFGVARILPTELTGVFALETDSFAVFLRLMGENKLEVVEKINYPTAFSDPLSFSDGQKAFALVQHEGSRIHFTVKLDNNWTSNLLEESFEMDAQRGLVKAVFINNYIRTDSSHGFRALIVMEDHSLLLLQQGEIVWSREDGLASVIDVTTSELPVEKDGVSVATVEHNLFEWLKGHILKLKGTLMLASPDDIVAIQGMRLKSSEKSKMTRDHNGFRKLLIVLTRAGKLFALHTGDGRVVWSLLLPSLRKSETCQNPTGLNIYQWQVPHHHAMDENPSILVVGRCGLGSDALGFLSFVDSYTGEELESLNLAHSIAQVIPLPFTD